MALPYLGPGGPRQVEQGGVVLGSRHDGGVLAVTRGEGKVAGATAATGVDHGVVHDLPAGDRSGVEPQLLAEAQRQCGQAVTAALVAWEGRLVEHHDGASRTGEGGGRCSAGGTAADHRHVE